MKVFLKKLEEYINGNIKEPQNLICSEELKSRKISLLVRLLKNSLDKSNEMGYDAAFRIIKYMTKQLALFYQLEYDESISRVYNKLKSQACIERPYFIENLSWAIPSKEAIHKIKEFAGSKLILEICAGLGLWTGLLRLLGCDVIATDTFTTHRTSREKALIDDIIPMDAVTSVITYNLASVLFLCWPGCYESYAADALEVFKGDKLIFIGEIKGGCTADDTFYDMLEAKWEEIGQLRILNWPSIHDIVIFYKRKCIVEDDSDSSDNEDV